MERTVERDSGFEGSGRALRDRLTRFVAVGEVGVLLALIVLVAFFYIIEPAFLSERNIRAILRVVSFIGIIAIGQTILLVNGEFDLSVGAVAGLSAVCSAKLMTALALPVPLALIGGVLVGAGIGLVNGLVVVKLKIPAFIQTLGMLFIGQGLIQVVTNGYPVYPLPPVITDIGYACKRVIKYFSQCHAAFLETNYDDVMLDNGNYPYHLKKRIRGEKGHLSNKQALELFKKYRPSFMSHLFLSHLSQNNNSPELVEELFSQHAEGVKMIVASRHKETAVYQINAEGDHLTQHYSVQPSQMEFLF